MYSLQFDWQTSGDRAYGPSSDQEALKQAAEDLRTATSVAASSCVIRKQTVGNLQVRRCKTCLFGLLAVSVNI